MAAAMLVLMEAGSVWPNWMHERAKDALVLQQAESDNGFGLFEEASQRIRDEAESLRTIVVICSANSGHLRAGSRAPLLQGLVSVLDMHVEAAEVIIVSDGDYGTRESLSELVWEIAAELESAQSSTRIRMRAQPRSTRPPAPAP